MPTPTAREALTPDGARISYDDLGQGEPALLLLPGWAHSRRVYEELAPRTAAHRRTLALDWRGQGRSGPPPGDFGHADMVEDALAVIEASGAQQVVPVGQAHGNWVIVELRRRLGERVPRLVALSWLVLGMPPAFQSALEAMQDPQRWQQARDALFAMWTEGCLTAGEPGPSLLLSRPVGSRRRPPATPACCRSTSAGIVRNTLNDSWHGGPPPEGLKIREHCGELFGMECSRFLDCLAADFARLRAVVPTDPTAAVPTCPGWTVADLTRHVGQVYLHKTVAMREGAEPDPWPPKELANEEPLALLDRAYARLLEEFAARKPEDPAGSWYTPDQTVGFWIRRMAQETVIHRIDAELGTGQRVAPFPADLAVDGIDELLKVFVAYSVAKWGNYFTDILAGSPGRTYTVRADGAVWRARTGPGLFVVEDGAGDDATDVTVSGPPTAVLRWVWNREGAGEPSGVTVKGAPEAVAELRRCIVTATQ